MLYRCCDGRRIGGRRCPSTKKPAAPNAAGFEADTAGTGGLAFAGGKGRPHPPFVAAGGIACGAAGPCALLAHRVPQVTSAGRNLITLFSSVNNLSRSFSTPRRRHARRMPPTHRQCMRARRLRDARRRRSNRLHASIGAACSDATKASMLHARVASGAARRACTTSAAKARMPHHRRRISRRTNAFARKVRELFRADGPPRCHASGAGGDRGTPSAAPDAGKKKPAAFPPRVFGSVARGALSGLRFPAARRTRPGPAAR